MRKLSLLLAPLALAALCVPFALGARAKSQEALAVACPAEPEGAVRIIAAPRPGADILFEVFSGARMALLGEEGAYVRVRVGRKGAGVVGYAAADEVRAGPGADREAAPYGLAVDPWELAEEGTLPLYAAPDAGGEPVGEKRWVFTASGVYGGWALCAPSVGWGRNGWEPQDAEAGFVQLPPGAEVGSEPARVAWQVKPLSGELTADEAYERAIGLALAHADEIERFRGEVTEEALRAMRCAFHLDYDGEAARWAFFFQDAEDYAYNFSLTMTAEGELVGIDAGKG